MSSNLPTYPGKDGTAGEHLAFSEEMIKTRIETKKASQDFAIYLGGTTLGEVFYSLAPEAQRAIEEGIASVWLVGFRAGFDHAEQANNE